MPAGGLPPGKAAQLAMLAKLVVRRDLTQQESDILMFPRGCRCYILNQNHICSNIQNTSVVCVLYEGQWCPPASA